MLESIKEEQFRKWKLEERKKSLQSTIEKLLTYFQETPIDSNFTTTQGPTSLTSYFLDLYKYAEFSAPYIDKNSFKAQVFLSAIASPPSSENVAQGIDSLYTAVTLAKEKLLKPGSDFSDLLELIHIPQSTDADISEGKDNILNTLKAMYAYIIQVPDFSLLPKKTDISAKRSGDEELIEAIEKHWATHKESSVGIDLMQFFQEATSFSYYLREIAELQKSTSLSPSSYRH